MLGAGNVATHLSFALQNAGINISQVYSRTEDAAKLLSVQINATFTNKISDICTDADIYFYCLKDSVLAEIIPEIKALEAIHIHTAGSMNIDVFAPYFKNYGVLYPLQTFSKNKAVNFSEVPVFIEASNEKVEIKLNYLASLITTKVYQISSEQRIKLHLAAVFACNFTNYLYTLSSEIVAEAQLPFDILIPLITETADKIKILPPYDAQTGPAVRNDQNVILKHFSLLSESKDKYKIYKELTKQIYKKYKED